MRSPAGFRGAFHLGEAHRAAASEHAGILRAHPAAVAVPRDPDDVACLVRWAAAEGIALIPRGAGTGMPGGAIGAGVVVDLVTHLSGIRIDASRRIARVLPGSTLGALDRAAAPHGLRFPVDPSSAERATVGGVVANNSGGARGVRYGTTRAWTAALDVVLADGSPARAERGVPPAGGPLRAIAARVDVLVAPHADALRAGWPRVAKNASGYALREYLDSNDLVDLVVGSEGTLAIVVGAELRLDPIPAAGGLALLEFDALDAVADAVERLLPLRPATCEMIDRTFIELVRAGGDDPGYPLSAGLEAILFVEVEGDSEAEVRDQLEAVRRAAAPVARRVTIARTPAETARFRAIRHAASPLIARMAGERISMQFIEDGVVPIARLAEYVRFLRALLERRGLPAVIFGHAGDGNLHVNPLVDVTEPGWRETAESMVHEVAEEVARLGGTMSGEHGDGRLRAPVLETVWGAERVALFRGVKAAFDPDGILNPGVILPLPGQRPLDGVRYG